MHSWKKFAFIFTLLAFSANAKVIRGMINWGPFVNCELYNTSSKHLYVKSYTYNIQLTNGALQTHTAPCMFNCELKPFEYKRFTGPQNSPYIMSATCSADVMRIYPRRRR